MDLILYTWWGHEKTLLKEIVYFEPYFASDFCYNFGNMSLYKHFHLIHIRNPALDFWYSCQAVLSMLSLCAFNSPTVSLKKQVK